MTAASTVKRGVVAKRMPVLAGSKGFFESDKQIIPDSSCGTEILVIGSFIHN
jgi:hypothetical protein